MSLLDAQGRPANQAKQRITIEQLLKALATHRQKLETLDLGMMQVSLFVEYFSNEVLGKLQLIEDTLRQHNIEADLVIDVGGFEAWADNRMEQLRQEALAGMTDPEQKVAGIPEGLGISLEDK